MTPSPSTDEWLDDAKLEAIFEDLVAAVTFLPKDMGNAQIAIYEAMSEAKQKVRTHFQAKELEGRIAELESIKGRKFTDAEMSGMDTATAQSARTLNSFIDDIENRIAQLKSKE